MSSKALASVPTNTTFATNLTSAKVSEATALLDLEAVDLVSTNLLQNYKGISKEEVKVLNKYYSQYGQDYLVENLAWSNDRILNTCKEPLRNKILEGMVGTSAMEMG